MRRPTDEGNTRKNLFAEPPVHFDMVIREDTLLASRLIQAFRNVFRQGGLQFTVERFPSRRGIEELKNGRVDGSLGRVDNLISMHGLTDYIRLDVATNVTTLTLWCNRDARSMKAVKNPRVAYRHSSALSTQMASRIEDPSVRVLAVSNYLNMLLMMQRDRLDCFLGTTIQLTAEGIKPQQLHGLHRHDIVTLPAYAWIAKKFAHWKPRLEKELRELVTDKEWKRQFLQGRTECGPAHEVLCPDGRIFARQVKFRDDV